MASRKRIQRRDVRELLVTICDCLQDPECCPRTESAQDHLDGTLADLKQFDARNPIPEATLRFFVSNNLVFWNEHEEAATREFWKRVKAKGLPFKRRDIVREVIKRGRIRDMSELELVIDEVGTTRRNSRLSARELKALAKLVAELETGRQAPKKQVLTTSRSEFTAARRPRQLMRAGALLLPATSSQEPVMTRRKRLQRRDVRELLVTICECLQDPECCPRTEGAGDILDGTLSALSRFDAWNPMPAATLKSVVSDRLVFWNEHEEAATREFWKRVKAKGLPFKRRDIVREVIKRGRIRDMSEFELVVDEIGTTLRDSRLTPSELKALTKLVADLETGRQTPKRRKRSRT